jgi:hypothetical protein
MRTKTSREVWWERIREDLEGGPKSRLPMLTTALLISTEAWPDGTHASLSAPELARFMKIGESTVRRYIDQLKKDGYLAIEERGHYRGDGAPIEPISSAQPSERLSDADDDLSSAQHGERLSEISTAQLDVSTAQLDVSTAHPRVSSPIIPIIPIETRAPAREAGESGGNGQSSDQPAPNARNWKKKQDQKADKPVWRCKKCRCHSKADHHRAINEGYYEEHPWLPELEEPNGRRSPKRPRSRARGP